MMDNFAQQAKSINNPQTFFNELSDIITKTASGLQRYNNIFPGIRPMLSTLKNVASAGEDAVDDLSLDLPSDDSPEQDNDLGLDIEENIALHEQPADADAQAAANLRAQQAQERERQLKGEIGNIVKQFSDYGKAVGNANLPEVLNSFREDIAKGLNKIAKQGTDPAVFFDRNPSVASDLRTVYQIIRFTAQFSKAVTAYRAKLYSIYRDEGDIEALLNTVDTNNNALLNNFNNVFQEMDFGKLLDGGQKEFDNFFLQSLFKASDVAGGGKFAQKSARIDTLKNRALAGMKKTLRESIENNLFEQDEDLENDADFQAAMRELQSDPATMTIDELSRQAEQELRQAASDEQLRELKGAIKSLIASFASKKMMNPAQTADFEKRFIEMSKKDVNRVINNLDAIVNNLKEDMTNILNSTLEKRVKQLINFRGNKVIPARESKKIPEDKANAYIKELNNVLILLNKLRKKYVLDHVEYFNGKKPPEGYKQWLETAKAKLDAQTEKVVDRFKEKFKQIKSGENPTPEQGADQPGSAADPNSLKGMNVGKINVALNQLRQKGISSKDINRQIDAAVKEISKMAGPQRRNFEEKDLPVINKIKDEIVKILNGDFSNLIRESSNEVVLHPVTYDIINNIIKESILGQMPKRYADVVHKWLRLNDRYSPEDMNKYISYIQNSEKREAIKILIAMAKELRAKKNIDDTPTMTSAPDQFQISDQWQEVPQGAVMPPGAEYRMDLDKEKTYARMIKEQYEINNNTNKDLSQLSNIVTQFYPYVKEKLNFNKDATINIVSDPKNAENPWGKTAQYDPNNMEITIFADNRHPKDMLRSLSHELVHHAQNCRGEFDKKQTVEPGYAQKDPHMRRMEGEAYLLGNGFLVRDFEDYLKSQQNQNLTENKKMKGLTNEQLRTVLENTINRITKEGFSGAMTAEPAMEEGETDCAKLEQRIQAAEDTVNRYGQGQADLIKAREAYNNAGCASKARPAVMEEKEEKISEEVVEAKEKGKHDDGDGKDEKCDHVPCNESLREHFTSKKNQMLFEKLTKIWTK